MIARPTSLLAVALLLAACGGGDPAANVPDVAPPRLAATPADPALASLLAERLAAVEARPRDAGAWGALGLAYDAHDGLDGDFADEALACYSQAAALAPGTFRWPYLAGTLVYVNDLAGALVWFDRALAADPGAAADNAPLFVRRGLGRLLTGDLAGARADLERATELDAYLALAWLGLARVALQDDDAEGALAMLERARAVGVTTDEIHGLEAEVQRRLGDPEAAAAAAARAQDGGRREPLPDMRRFEVAREGASRAWAERVARGFLARDEVDRALEVWRTVIARGDDPEARLALAELALQAGRVDEMRAQHAALALSDDQVELRARVELQRGAFAQRSGDPTAAREHYRAALELTPDDALIRGNLGLAELQAGDATEGLNQLRAASAALAPSSDMQFNFLRALVGTEQWDEAQQVLERISAVREESGYLAFTRGQVLAGRERFDEAAAAFARAVELEPENEVAIVNRALALERGGREPAALELLRAEHARLVAAGAPALRVGKALAWRLATTRDEALVDGEGALRIAREVLRSAPRDPELLDVMAAALAAAGNFEHATQHAQLAQRWLAELPPGAAPTDRVGVLAGIAEREATYASGERWRRP